LHGNQRGANEVVFFFPQMAIREFQMVRSGATAEVGRTNAGFVNAVNKSGANEVHGETFFFNRNRKLASPDASRSQTLNLQYRAHDFSASLSLEHCNSAARSQCRLKSSL